MKTYETFDGLRGQSSIKQNVCANRFKTQKAKFLKSKTLQNCLAIIALLGLSINKSSAQAPPVTYYQISGKVIRAAKGLPLTGVGSTPAANTTPPNVSSLSLYIYIIRQGGIILKWTTVNPITGEYVIDSLVAGVASAAQLSANLYDTGKSVDYIGLPSSYYFAVGEGDQANGDGTPDYSFPLAQSADIIVNFGFDARPSSINALIDTITYLNDRLIVPKKLFNGSDLEDGTYPNNLTGRTVDLYTAVPTATTQLYYYDTLLKFTTSFVTILNFNPEKVSIKVSNTLAFRSFSYTVADDAGARPFVPTTITTTIPLSITLASMSGFWQKDAAVINWATASEKTNDYFILERSTDGANFSNITKVASQAIKGNSDKPLLYTYTDNALKEKNITGAYYRLRAVDNAGVSTISRIVHVSSGKAETTSSSNWNIFPNPATDKITVSTSADLKNTVKLNLLQANGSILQSRELNANSSSQENTFDLSKVPGGNYFLQIIDDKGNMETKKITVAH